MNYDPIDTCPYDPVHRIMRSRMQFHLTKCAKNWPNAPKKQCPFDARHIINDIEFSYHITICPQRESVWHYKIMENEADPQPKILPIDSTPAAAQTEENWKENNSNRQASSIKTTIPEETSLDVDLEYKPLRRPKKLPLNASTMSDLSSLNESIDIDKTIQQNNPTQPVIPETSIANDNAALYPKKVFSYAAALKQNSSIGSDVVIKSVKLDNYKENNSSFLNSTLDESLNKVSKTVKELTIGDKGHKAQSESLDKTLESLKNFQISKSAKKSIKGINHRDPNLLIPKTRSKSYKNEKTIVRSLLNNHLLRILLSSRLCNGE